MVFPILCIYFFCSSEKRKHLSSSISQKNKVQPCSFPSVVRKVFTEEAGYNDRLRVGFSITVSLTGNETIRGSETNHWRIQRYSYKVE